MTRVIKERYLIFPIKAIALQKLFIKAYYSPLAVRLQVEDFNALNE